MIDQPTIPQGAFNPESGDLKTILNESSAQPRYETSQFEYPPVRPEVREPARGRVLKTLLMAGGGIGLGIGAMALGPLLFPALGNPASTALLGIGKLVGSKIHTLIGSILPHLKSAPVNPFTEATKLIK